MIELNPVILLEPSIPPALHGTAPRTIWSASKWNKERELVLEQYNNQCAACGVRPNSPHAHEHYEYDYENARSYFKCIYPLCHSCHDYIHSQRTFIVAMKSRNKVEIEKFWEVAYRGNTKLLEHDLFPNIVLLNTVLYAMEQQVMPMSHVKYWQHLLNNYQGIVKLSLDQYEELGIMPRSILHEPKFSEWRLVVDGVEYEGKFKTREEWEQHYK